MRITRRSVMRIIGAAAFSGITMVLLAGKVTARRRYVRPPGALGEEEFLSRCIRCYLCGEACPYRAIGFVGAEDPVAYRTPYIATRYAPCWLCMECTRVCPTGALKEIKPDKEEVLEKVRMGVAKVNEHLCIAYNGQVCGICYWRCPLKDVAIKRGRHDRPLVQEDACVGCGVCDYACIIDPSAISVIPMEEYLEMKQEGRLK
jgi:MauM/NapG family ferredoxin protein